MRLGFRMIKGFARTYADQLVEARQRAGRFTSIPQFHRTTGLPRHAMERLAEADAFGSLGLSRREALWQIMALDDEPAPLFEQVDHSVPSPQSSVLPAMPLGQEVMTDYAKTGLSLKRHPVALVREQLQQMRVVAAEQVQHTPHGKWVKVAGLVLIRQRPGTAAGIVFATVEDETGVVNLIVRPDVFERYRSAARHAALLAADGYIERQGQVVHVMAKRLYDLTGLIQGYQLHSRDFH